MMSLLSGICSNSTVLPYSLHNNNNPTKQFFLSCSSLVAQNHNLVSFKIQTKLTNKRLSLFCCCCSEAQQSQLNSTPSYTEESKKTTTPTTPNIRRKKLALFVSGGGSNFRSIHHACLRGFIHADVVVLVTNNPGCGGSEFATSQGIPVITFPKAKDVSLGVGALSPTDLVSLLRNLEVDFILLAGYLKLIPSELVQAYPKSILNIHPALLPAFGGKGYYGMKVHQAVIASGARYSGPTIHFVDDQYDTGRILAQRVVPVLANDTAEDLAARVLKEEHKLYVDVASALCEERIIWREDGVPLIQSKDNPSEYK